MANAINHIFAKAEKLKSRKQIDLLFREGKSFFAAPVKCFFRLERVQVEELTGLQVEKLTSKTGLNIEDGEPKPQPKNPQKINHKQQNINTKAGFSVSKKQFKKAVDRNRVKRLMREAYRLHKHNLIVKVEAKNARLEIFFVFTDKALPSYSLVEEKVKYCLRRLGKIVEGNV